MLKVYEVQGYLNLQKEIEVDGKIVAVNFTGGHRYPHKSGTYATDDKKIQKALEARPEFKVEYKLVQVGNKKLNKSEQTTSINERVMELEKENERLQKLVSELNAQLQTKSDTEKPKELKIVHDVVNAQQAKEYLVKEFNHNPDKLKNKMIILQAAKKYSVSFPDWK